MNDIDSGAQPRLFFNRELSLLAFNRRVLELARDPKVPLLERLRFLCISSSNLDEFFEIRVAGLKQHVAFELGLPGPDALAPQTVLQRVSRVAHGLVADQYRVLNDEMLPALNEHGIFVLKREEWTDRQRTWIRDFFLREVLPVLTPVGLDPAHPFPRIVNKSLNFIVSLKGKDAFGRRSRMAVVQAPRLFPRLVALPDEVATRAHEFVMISSVIHDQMDELFPGMKVVAASQFRVTRDSDLWVDEEEVDDLLSALKGELSRRRFAGACRLEVADTCSEEMQRYLLKEFGLTEEDLYIVNGPVNLHRLSALYDMVDRADMKYPAFTQGNPMPPSAKSRTLFGTIRRRDLLLHHPYQSFLPVVRFVNDAARDPGVLAIKMTVYRTGEDSPLAAALIEAARAGKEVTAVVELRARFDEEANIGLATKLQEAGAKVVYGVVGYKTHCKMLLVVRREDGKLRRYAHLGTGNYHTGTSRAYTDFGLMTSDRRICEDVHRLFQQLTGLGRVEKLEKLLQSPFTLHKHMLDAIGRETAEARAGREARIIVKTNSLIEARTIEALYEASQAGVEIDLIVRGICCLVPGVPGVSENIRVRSVLGRFLEHTRVFYFHAGGDEELWLSSADWMPRNFFRRVEVAFPVEDKKLRRRVIDEGLLAYLTDNAQTWTLRRDGSYERLTPGDEPAVAAHRVLLKQLATGPIPDDAAEGDEPAPPPLPVDPADDAPASAPPVDPTRDDSTSDEAESARRISELFATFKPRRG